jgi:hypothetical protein
VPYFGRFFSQKHLVALLLSLSAADHESSEESSRKKLGFLVSNIPTEAGVRKKKAPHCHLLLNKLANFF